MAKHDASLASKDREIQRKDGELKYRQAKIDQLTHEMAVLKRWKFGRSGERLDAAQLSLLDETLDEDIAAIELELKELAPTPRAEAEACQPRHARLPPRLPRVEITHEPESTVCATLGCRCTLRRIGEDISEKRDYTPGVFTVERHIRGKWACSKCQSLTQAPVPAQVTNKGIPTAGLLVQVLVTPQIDEAVGRITRASRMPPLLVCHSMDGLAARSWLKLMKAEARVHHVVTIGTPHRGTWLARFGNDLNDRQMRLHSSWNTALDHGMPTERHMLFTCWYLNCDNIVFTASNATLPGAGNRLVGAQHMLRWLLFLRSGITHWTCWILNPLKFFERLKSALNIHKMSIYIHIVAFWNLSL